VVEELQERQDLGLSLNATAVFQGRPDLHAAAVRRFGSYRLALEEAGLSDHEWTRDRVVAELRRRAGERGRLSAKQAGPLTGAAQRCFGSYSAACEAAGIECGLPPLAPASILYRVRKRVRKNQPIDAASVRRDDPRLYDSARRRFGTWSLAVSAAVLRR